MDVFEVLAAVIAKPQPPGLQHLLRIKEGGSGSVPSKYPGSEDKNRREMGGDERRFFRRECGSFRRPVEAVVNGNGGFFK